MIPCVQLVPLILSESRQTGWAPIGLTWQELRATEFMLLTVDGCVVTVAMINLRRDKIKEGREKVKYYKGREDSPADRKLWFQ